MSVVFTIGEGFQVVTTVEELGDISAAGALNDELATGMVGSIVSGVKDQVVEEDEVASALAGNSVEFFLSDGGQGADELEVLAQEDLIMSFHNNQWHQEGNGGNDPKVVKLVASCVVRVNTGGNAPDAHEDH